MIHDAVLLADADWVRILIVLIFVLGPLLGQLGKREAPKPAQRPPRRQPARPPDPMEMQMRKILEQAQQAGARKQPPDEAAQGRGAAKPKKRPQAVAPRRTVTDRPQPKPIRSVTEHVQEHVLSHPVTEHAKGLGRVVEQADERVESHLRAAFDRRLGDLAQLSSAEQTGFQVAEGTDLSIWNQSARERRDEQLAANRDAVFDMLSRPEQLRNVFILGEILGPPPGLDERW